MLSIFAGTFLATFATASQYGTPEIARFHGGCESAVSLEFDDSMNSQIEHALPLLNARKLRGTFFVNPGRDSHKKHQKTWEVDMPKAGHELGNHTMNHIGARDVAELEKEIRECSEVLARVYGRAPKLIPFAHPGGVPWQVTPQQEQPIFQRYLLIPTTNRRFFEEATLDPVKLAQEAIDRKSWVQIGFHGTGGEWLNTTIPTFTRLLDFLVEHRKNVWIAPTMEVTKYIRERDAALPPTLSDVNTIGFTMRLEFDEKKLPSFGYKASDLYRQPLTVDIPVPTSWKGCSVKQGARFVKGKVVDKNGRRVARVDVIPFGGSVRVEKG